jgi:hypothetical protein
MERLYCSVAELIEDIGDVGKTEAFLVGKIESASLFIEQRKGNFLPLIETRALQADPGHPTELLVQPLLGVTSIRNDGTALASTDFVLCPDGRHWQHGPYTSIQIAEDGSAGAWSQEQSAVEITGPWGLYDEAVSVAVSAVTQLLADTTIVVSDGSKISPGMMLLIESEWELVTSTGSASDSTANLITEIDDTDEELSLINGSLLSAGEVIRIGFERMQVIEVLGNVVQVLRGFEGSKRAVHLAGADVYVFRTFNVSRGASGSTAAAHSLKSVAQQKAPADVNYLCRQIAALMVKKASTGYVGRAGNDDLGGGFWLNEFPKSQIDNVMNNYVWGG